MLTALVACNNPKLPNFDAYLEEKPIKENLALYRLPSTYLGESRYNDTFLIILSKEKEIALNEKYKAGLAQFPDDILSEDQRSKQLMLWEIDIALADKTTLST